MSSPSSASSLSALLFDRIRRQGPLTFADYMRECLYHPQLGYYSRAEARRFADYYTSVDVHPVFGRLLARQFAEMWEQLSRPAEFRLVEAGAGVGRLAGHVLDFAEARLPELYAALKYVAVERSSGRRAQSAGRLARHIAAGRCEVLLEVPARISTGCLFSNELLDALPVHRVVQRGGALQELFVGGAKGKFEEILAPLSTCAITDYFAAQGILLQEGQQAEAGLEACDWITEIARRIERGFLLTVDYGLPAAELFDAYHLRGTLLAYRGHRADEDYYGAPGEQDLTAHVNFTALEQWGARGGLEPLGTVSQTEFLMALGKGNEFEDLYEPGAGEAERVRARLLLKTLIFPEGMGGRFRVLIQQKGVPGARLTGLAGIV
ncbi:MAG: SAM-dependent methyltransferase [Acidobacteriia bacterium]|nr:SAM-dependent methyltransferase [Terriglobia bacterium]